MDSIDSTCMVAGDDAGNSTNLDVVLASDLRELLDLIEGECRALRAKDSLRRNNAANGSVSDSDNGESLHCRVNISSVKPGTLVVGTIDDDYIMICDKAGAWGENRDLSDHKLMDILEEIEDSCHKFRSAEELSCSTAVTCSSSEDGSSSQGDSLDPWLEQNCVKKTSFDEEAGGDNERNSLFAAACALRAGAEAWALKGRSKYAKKKKKKQKRLCKTTAQPVEKLRGPRIRQCKPIDPMEI
uniref:Uncharacterized protein n=1 Tax=Odontella aurita TaxID=265563 RepID=A0A6U6DK23_9STRA|mmetsp:Transcript_21130/g.61461  ORF Transcript_21130/g.61461 Transcript_21130/m.61461 type:complete len:242 (+) Transcript_21130:264-989(+)